MKLSALWTLVRFTAGWLFTLMMSAMSCALIFFLGPARMWLVMARPWARGAICLVGVKLKIDGAENLTGPAVFVSNHQSLIDVVFLPAILPRKVRWVAKKELLRIPLWGWAFGAGGAVLIDRKNPRAAILNIREGLKRLPKGWSVVVFPEGTRSLDGTLKPFKKGAFHIALETGMPMVPIGMDGAHDIVPLGASLVRAGEVRVTVGKPIPTDTWTEATLDQHIAQVRDTVQACVDAAARRRPPAQAAPLRIFGLAKLWGRSGEGV